jgi:thiopeptide-type bacteriocin biosynthesis protein
MASLPWPDHLPGIPADRWRQVSIAFPDWDRAEATVLAGLAPQLAAAETGGLIDASFFIRKRPCWRVRYLPAAGTAHQARTRIEDYLGEMTSSRLADTWTAAVYEPEVHAFGGDRAMTVAHRLFHHDSRCLLAYLRGDLGAGTAHRREISVLLCSIFLRAARQEWYEQGDIWARVAAHRELPAGHNPADPGRLAAVRRLVTVDAESQMRGDAPLAWAAGWAASYETAGRDLAGLAATGHLHRGLRDILAHHVIFAWNRLGLPYATQAILAATARTVIFGPDPATQRDKQGQR